MLKHYDVLGNHEKIKMKYLQLKSLAENELKTLETKRKLIQDQEKHVIDEILYFFANVEALINSRISELLNLLKSSLSFHEKKKKLEQISKVIFNNEMIDNFLLQTNKIFTI